MLFPHSRRPAYPALPGRSAAAHQCRSGQECQGAVSKQQMASTPRAARPQRRGAAVPVRTGVPVCCICDPAAAKCHTAGHNKTVC